MIIALTFDFSFLIKFKIQIDSQGTGFWFGVYSWPRILYGPLATLSSASLILGFRAGATTLGLKAFDKGCSIDCIFSCEVLQSKEKILTDSYKFRVKDGSFVTLKSQWFSFTNPWTKELEYIVSVNTLVL